MEGRVLETRAAGPAHLSPNRRLQPRDLNFSLDSFVLCERRAPGVAVSRLSPLVPGERAFGTFLADAGVLNAHDYEGVSGLGLN